MHRNKKKLILYISYIAKKSIKFIATDVYMNKGGGFRKNALFNKTVIIVIQY